MSFQHSYSFLDRLLHRLAFATRPAQIAIADIEDNLYKRELANINVNSPVFISALPRAGTTVLLECLEQCDELVSHNYRDMPFVLTPLLWSKFSTSFSKNIEKRERAHGDGMAVDLESPEAFEEIIWSGFWKQHYQQECIQPWGLSRDTEFESFFRQHIKKIKLLRAQKPKDARYLSKNNLNIARLPYLAQLFPQGKIIVPFREPYSQAQSLLRQHLNFCQMHQADTFAKDYMRGLGHFDFGDNLKPVNFSGWIDRGDLRESHKLSFWLRYWIAIYGSLLNQRIENRRFLSFSNLRSSPSATLEKLALFIGLQTFDLDAAAEQIKPLPPAEKPVQKGIANETAAQKEPVNKELKDLLSDANIIYTELNAVALNT